MYGFERFEAAISRAVLPLAARDLKGVVRRRRTARREDFYRGVAQDFWEVVDSRDALRALTILTRHSPPRATGLSRSTYLRLNRDAYLQEAYILSERLERFGKRLAQHLKHDEPELEEICSRLVSEFKQGPLRQLIVARGRIVHQLRDDDAIIAQLRRFELVASVNSEIPIEGVYRKVRKAQATWMQFNNAVIELEIESFFGGMLKFTVHPNGRLRLPSKCR